MISIKRFLEQRFHDSPAGQDSAEALTQMVHVLLDGMSTHVVRGRDTDVRSLRRNLEDLVRQMTGPQTAMSLLGISSDALEALETYCYRTSEYLREQTEERKSMVAMLTETVADLSGQSEASVVRLQAIEKQVERASELDDIRSLRANLADSLAALRDAAAHERSRSAATMERLKAQIATAQPRSDEPVQALGQPEIELTPDTSDEPLESVPTAYVAAFRLARAEHIASRFGEGVKHQMLSVIGSQLKSALAPGDRLLRWKGTSFVMFINSTGSLGTVRARLSEAVAATGQQYIEVGRKTALLSIGVDWIVFPQAERPSLDAVFAEVDVFLAGARQNAAPAAAHRIPAGA